MPRPITVFDLETGPTEAALAMEPDEAWLTNGIRDNFKPETVEKYRADNVAKWPEEITKRASLDWRLGRIVAVGIKHGDSDDATHVLMNADESVLLTETWGTLAQLGGVLVGFNIRNFDLPWLLGRSGALGVEAGRGYDARRYGGGDVIDWSDILVNYGSFSMSGWSLDKYATWFALGEGYGKGSDIAEWWRTGQHEEIKQHCRADLNITWAMHHRFAPAFLPRVA